MTGLLRFLRSLWGPAAPAPVDEDVQDVVCVLPEENPLECDAGTTLRSSSALSLMDDDTYGFIVLRVCAVSELRTIGKVEVTGFVAPEVWPAVRTTLERVTIVGSERVG